MVKIKFALNNKIEFKKDDKVYKSDIQDVAKDHISISIPIYEGQFIPLRNGDKMEAFYYDDASIYKFSTVIIGRSFEKIPVLQIPIPDHAIKIQRRGFVRVSVLYDIKIEKYNDENIDILDDRHFSDAMMLDLSGGGMRVSTKQILDYGDKIIAKIPVVKGDVVVKGKIVRKLKNEGAKQDFSYGVKFDEMRSGDRDKIIQFVFQIMREQRKKV